MEVVDYLFKEEFSFPPFSNMTSYGLLAIGGDLHPYRLLSAYSEGIFPWYNPEDEIHWWVGRFRPVYIPGHIHLGRNMKRKIKSEVLEIRMDENPLEVMESCAHVKRIGQNDTWISKEIMESYMALFNLGYLHTVEVFKDNTMIGGLYGISLGKVFFGESMFQKEAEASKIALFALSEYLFEKGYNFIDSQVSNPHSFRMGAHELPFEYFYKILKKSLQSPSCIGKWNFNIESLQSRIEEAVARPKSYGVFEEFWKK